MYSNLTVHIVLNTNVCHIVIPLTNMLNFKFEYLTVDANEGNWSVQKYLLNELCIYCVSIYQLTQKIFSTGLTFLLMYI